MLTPLRRLVIGLAVSVLTFAAALVAMSLAASPAAAAPSCVPPAVIKWIGVSEYECVIPAPEPSPGTTDPGGQNPGVPQPTCDLPAAPPPSGVVADHVLEGPYCQGTRFCVTTDLVVPLALPDGEPPNEDSEARYRWCSSGGAYQMEESWWTGENEPPSLLERALSAIGQINLATPTLNTSPTGRTLVSLDTWFWAGGASPSATGSAFDLVATATFSSMTVETGDGTTLSCPLTTTSAAAERDCTHAYRKASVGGSTTVGGRPAYSASVRLVYDLSFTVGGNAIVVPGAPATLEAPLDSTAIRVDEVQSVVTDVD